MAQQLLIAGRWRVEPDLNRIVGPDGAVSVEDRVMRVLVLLARRAGQTVRREELLEVVWGGRHVTEESLTNVISRLRRVMGDDPRQPQIILTVPKRGYRLIGSVERLGSSKKVATAAKLPRAAWGLTLVVLVIVGVAVAARWVGRSGGGSEGAALEPRPLTSAPGVEFDPAFSADGRRFAYVWGGDDDSDLNIWIRGVDAAAPRKLTTRAGFDGSPSWRPDGGAVAFMHSRDGDCGVFIAEIDSSDERRIAECKRHSESSVDWSPLGELVAFADSPASGKPFRILVAPVSGGSSPRALTSPAEASYGDLDPAFSPDGGLVAFVRGTNRSLQPTYVSPVHGDVYVVSVDGGEPRRLTYDNEEVPGLGWSLDGRRIVFASTRETGRHALWEVGLDGDPPRRLLALDGMLRNPTPHPAGLAFERVRGTFDLWSLDLRDESSAPRPLLRSTRSERAPALSPDGRRLAFVSDRSGQPEIWLAAADGTNPIQLTRLGLPSTSRPRWSPDARWVAFEARQEGRTSLWRVEATGGEPEWLLGASDGETWHAIAPRYSPTGDRLYFGSDRGGDWQLWALSLPDRRLEQVTEQGGVAVVGVGGEAVYYVRSQGKGVWRKDENGIAERIGDELRPSDWSNWALDGLTPVRLRRTSWTSGLLERVDGDPAEAKVVAELESDHNLIVGGITVSPDGSTLIWSQRSRLDLDILTAAGFR